ncbi:MAG TPA: hypothetical protein VGU20_31180 [Stellaceae bacterium]|nr:hypothetical protein [Terriglobia bacterium]HEV2551815.1 hypothetical protein [Stellaceae bacterium]
MIALIEGLFGIKVPAWLIEAVLAFLLIAGAALYLEHRGAREELAKLQESSTKLLDQAKKDIQTQTDRHTADVKANEGKTDAAIAAANALSDALDQRVRDFDAYRASHPDVPRSSGEPGAAGGGECGLVSCGELAGRALQDGNRLARSVVDLSAELQSCQRDRDSLNGLP